MTDVGSDASDAQHRDWERRGVLLAGLRLRVYFTDVIRASYVFRRTVSLFHLVWSFLN